MPRPKWDGSEFEEFAKLIDYDVCLLDKSSVSIPERNKIKDCMALTPASLLEVSPSIENLSYFLTHIYFNIAHLDKNYNFAPRGNRRVNKRNSQ